MYRKHIAKKELEDMNSRGRVAPSLYPVLEKTLTAQDSLLAVGNPQYTLRETVKHLDTAIKTINEVKKLAENVKDSDGEIKVAIDKGIVGYLSDNFTVEKSTLVLSDETLDSLSDLLKTQKDTVLRIIPAQQNFQVSPQVYDEPVFNNNPHKKQLWKLAETHAGSMNVNYKNDLKPFIKNILPAAHYDASGNISKVPYYLELTPELQKTLHAQNLNPEYLIKVNGRTFFAAETKAAKLEIEKKIRGLVLSIYDEGLETALAAQESLAASQGLLNKTLLQKKLAQEYLNQAMLYAQMAVLENDSSVAFYDPAAASANWLAKAADKIKQAEPRNILQRKTLEKSILKDYLQTYAEDQGIILRNDKAPAPVAAIAAATTAAKPAASRKPAVPPVAPKTAAKPEAKTELESAAPKAPAAPAASIKKTTAPATAAVSLPKAEAASAAETSLEKNLIASVQSAANWQNLIIVLKDDNNKKLLQDKNSEYYHQLMQAVQKAADEKFGENFHGDKQKATREIVNNAALEKEFKDALIKGVSASFNRRHNIIRGLIAGAILAILLALKFFAWPILAGVLKNIIDPEIPAERQKELIIDEEEFFNKDIGGAGNPLYYFGDNADDLGF